jgi:hypothetical protein
MCILLGKSWSYLKRAEILGPRYSTCCADVTNQRAFNTTAPGRSRHGDRDGMILPRTDSLALSSGAAEVTMNTPACLSEAESSVVSLDGL